jgi:excisionase family DNA binding protein
MSHSISGQTDRVDRIAYTMREAAASLGICERSVWAAIQDGRLKASRLGRSVRIRADELDRFLRDSES